MSNDPGEKQKQYVSNAYVSMHFELNHTSLYAPLSWLQTENLRGIFLLFFFHSRPPPPTPSPPPSIVHPLGLLSHHLRPSRGLRLRLLPSFVTFVIGRRHHKPLRQPLNLRKTLQTQSRSAPLAASPRSLRQSSMKSL